jgi:hypothetical protein
MCNGDGIRSRCDHNVALQQISCNLSLHAKPNLQFVYVIEILGKSAMGIKANQELT